jgi:hypothetical protein
MTSGSSHATPERPLPPYAFVSPCWPHPRTHPSGHSYGAPEPHAEPLDPSRWAESAEHLRSVELFNRGYYWEAHEGWEALWNAAGRVGPVADFFRGLIKLAAAGIKVRQGRADGVRIHAERALACFAAVRGASGAAKFAGLDLDALDDFARDVRDRAAELQGDARLPVEVVFARRLEVVSE